MRGGARRDTETFYTALYHALLAPRTFNDVGGTYVGMAGKLHDSGRRTQYADFSGWDVYRTQIPLLATLMPRRASDIVASMLAVARQSGCLPRWSYANGQSMTMVGDPADRSSLRPTPSAPGASTRPPPLAAMLKGATDGCRSADGSYVQRQGLERQAGGLESGRWPIPILSTSAPRSSSRPGWSGTAPRPTKSGSRCSRSTPALPP